ncbi:MAG: molybdenum cofactor guanylyltransferase [Sideroxydans sp.]
MGRDKARVELHGQALLDHVIASLQPLFCETLVSVRTPRPEIALPQVVDDAAYAGPLAGLQAGLARMRTPWLFVAACDMPFITPALVRQLADLRRADVQAVIPCVQGELQPLAGFYAASVQVPLAALLAGSGRHSLRALLERISVRRVEETLLRRHDATLATFFDLDTPADLARARTLTR